MCFPDVAYLLMWCVRPGMLYCCPILMFIFLCLALSLVVEGPHEHSHWCAADYDVLYCLCWQCSFKTNVVFCSTLWRRSLSVGLNIKMLAFAPPVLAWKTREGARMQERWLVDRDYFNKGTQKHRTWQLDITGHDLTWCNLAIQVSKEHEFDKIWHLLDLIWKTPHNLSSWKLKCTRQQTKKDITIDWTELD